MNPQVPGGPLPPNNQAPSQPPMPQPLPPQANPEPSGASQAYPAPPSAPGEHPLSQYEFIMSPDQNKRGLRLPSFGSLAGGSKMIRLGIIGAATVLVIIIIAVVASLLSSSGKGALQSIIPVTQDQAELARVATLAQTQAVDQTVKDLAMSVQLSQETASQQTLQYLSKNHMKVSAKTLGQKANAQTTTALTKAAADNTFDTVFLDAIETQLSTYGADLQHAYKANPGPNGQKLLSQEFDGAKLLLEQAKQATPSAN